MRGGFQTPVVEQNWARPVFSRPQAARAHPQQRWRRSEKYCAAKRGCSHGLAAAAAARQRRCARTEAVLPLGRYRTLSKDYHACIESYLSSTDVAAAFPPPCHARCASAIMRAHPRRCAPTVQQQELQQLFRRHCICRIPVIHRMSKTKAALSHASSPLALAACIVTAVVLTALLVPAARRWAGTMCGVLCSIASAQC